ncbi:uncharacterized protein LOC114336463 isoform X1 [Diabrotica virgifera virgifera]|uniref:Salivary secreted peptide n=1 Tax=Diabrotica virgifera virgifera TaxID=50390 RepID=A0ABM5KLG1_DIAVI|nr:uncharacterized protein LOC114336463 isoform X1 [Diabrotica virgifera virgifera]
MASKMKKIVCAFFCLFVAFQLVDAYPRFQLRVGNCLYAVASDLVHQEHVHRTRLPFINRTATAKYYGDKKIYCIIATSQKDASKGSTVEIKDGGVNHNFVNFEFNSSKNHGLEYNVQVYARYF